MIGGLISAGASIIGGMMTNDTNQSNAELNNATSLDIAKHGMEYKVADLRAAGLNPALAYNSGPINMPNLSTPTIVNPANNASQAFMAAAQMDKLKADTDVSNAQAGLLKIQQMREGAMATSAASQASTDALNARVRQALSQDDQDIKKAWITQDADTFKAGMDKAYAISDGDGRLTLDKYAKTQGFASWTDLINRQDLAVSKATLAGLNLGNQLSAADLPHARNAATFSSEHPIIDLWMSTIGHSAHAMGSVGLKLAK